MQPKESEAYVMQRVRETRVPQETMSDQEDRETATRMAYYDVQIQERVTPANNPYDTQALLTVIALAGGMAEAAYNVSIADHEHSCKIGYGVASNAGRLAGSIGHPEGLGELREGYSAQEEDTISNWLIS